ncbi:hypothetical protein C4J93_1876 [Pseudomonas sp. R2-37-08W]|nr:hypothetical protein C4J93_1876 [Pseudomonas sp. R2-37-08W]
MALAQQHFIGGQWVTRHRRIRCQALGPILAFSDYHLARAARATAAGERHRQAAGEHGVKQQLVAGLKGFPRGGQFDDMAHVLRTSECEAALLR